MVTQKPLSALTPPPTMQPFTDEQVSFLRALFEDKGKPPERKFCLFVQGQRVGAAELRQLFAFHYEAIKQEVLKSKRTAVPLLIVGHELLKLIDVPPGLADSPEWMDLFQKMVYNAVARCPASETLLLDRVEAEGHLNLWRFT